VEVLARAWAAEAQHTALKVNSVDPGATRTAMRAQAMPGEDPAALPHPREVGAKIAALALPSVAQTGMLYSVRAGQFQTYRLPE
jgi:NAD(P)-dependent dehydrogenase (short-subunit alcohol dehydrogenase family)